MKELAYYGYMCMEELDGIQIEYGENIVFTINGRAKSRWGQCKKVDGGFIISISKSLLDDRNDDKPLKTTIMHELLHTVDGCMNHGNKWTRLANKVNKYLGYNVQRCTSIQDKGLNEELVSELITAKVNRIAEMPTYKVVCDKCGYMFIRHKLSKLITNTSNYRCGACNGSLTRIA